MAALPGTLLLREVRYGIGRPGFRTRQITLVTTLLDAAVYRADELAGLYRLRWQVETSLPQLKTTMQMEVLHCKTVPGVLKELTVFAIVYNLVRMVMCQSARLQHIGVERISFMDALRWVSAPSTGMPLGALLVHPVRPHQVEPRVKKRRSKPFPLMIKPGTNCVSSWYSKRSGANLMPFGRDRPRPGMPQNGEAAISLQRHRRHFLQRVDTLRPHRGPDLVSGHSFGSDRCMQPPPLVQPAAGSSMSQGVELSQLTPRDQAECRQLSRGAA